MTRPTQRSTYRWPASASLRAGRFVGGLAALAVIGLTLGGCATAEPTATACPLLSGWPPSLPAPPAGVVVAHPAGTIVHVLNGTGAPIKVRFRTWTPNDCGATPPFGGDAGSVLAPGKTSDWSGDVPRPLRGPVLGGVEIWTGGCDATCGDPPDSFLSFEVPRAP